MGDQNGKTNQLGSGRDTDLLATLALLHVAIYSVAASWAFGGQAAWVREPLTVWGSLSFFITGAALLRLRRGYRRILLWMAPLILFDAFVIVGALNPNLKEIRSGADALLIPTTPISWLPSSARPELALAALWDLNAMWFSAFNVAILVRTRRALRQLLLLLGVNAVLLSVFGSVQKLAHSSGIYFGAIPSPQEYFFSTFVYHNHWGAFALLTISGWLALLTYFRRRYERRRPLHSPTLTGIVAVLLIAATLPLSASRSSTILLTVMMGVAFVSWMIEAIERRRLLNESPTPVVAAGVVAVLLGASAIGYLARDVIARRSELTVEQLRAAMVRRDSRITVYGDTLRMAGDRPWFGWGMHSYPHVFMLYNSRTSPDHRPLYYHDAHSDWLQSLAEHGIMGTLALMALAIIPLASALRALRYSQFARYLLLGCGVVVLYGALEFPFGNYAVVLMWWIWLMVAARYAELTWAKQGRAP